MKTNPKNPKLKRPPLLLTTKARSFFSFIFLITFTILLVWSAPSQASENSCAVGSQEAEDSEEVDDSSVNSVEDADETIDATQTIGP